MVTESLAVPVRHLRDGRDETIFQPRRPLEMQELLEHDYLAVEDSRRLLLENQRLRQRIAVLEKLVQARG